MLCSLTLPRVELVCLADGALGARLVLLHWVGTVEASSPIQLPAVCSKHCHCNLQQWDALGLRLDSIAAVALR